MPFLFPRRTSDRRGAASVLALVTVVGIAGLCTSILAVNLRRRTEQRSFSERTQALYFADAGVSSAVAALATEIEPDLGTAEEPTQRSGGSFFGDVTDNGDDTFTVRSNGTAGREQVGVEAIVERLSPDASGWALFAGNAASDPSYTLKIGGTLLSTDNVLGNVYSGGNLRLFGNATISGDSRAGGLIVGTTGLAGRPLPAPDFAAMNYAVNHDYDVKALFTSASYGLGGGGLTMGFAHQLPATSPAHIFRKNPSDRLLFTAFTAKDDYFLEDPHEPWGLAQVLGAPYDVSIPASANNKVYYVDGNLWTLNVPMVLPAAKFRIKGGGATGTHVTFVVKGNVYFSENFNYNDAAKDGIAFVAIKDPAVADSGNVYIGGTVPQLGTCSSIDGYVYAEGSIRENNLVSTGVGSLLGPITVRGNLVAREKITVYDELLILHSQLTVNFDPRLSTGALTLPGIPGRSAADVSYDVVSWRLVPVP